VRKYSLGDEIPSYFIREEKGVLQIKQFWTCSKENAIDSINSGGKTKVWRHLQKRRKTRQVLIGETDVNWLTHAEKKGEGTF